MVRTSDQRIEFYRRRELKTLVAVDVMKCCLTSIFSARNLHERRDKVSLFVGACISRHISRVTRPEVTIDGPNQSAFLGFFSRSNRNAM